MISHTILRQMESKNSCKSKMDTTLEVHWLSSVPSTLEMLLMLLLLQLMNAALLVKRRFELGCVANSNAVACSFAKLITQLSYKLNNVLGV